MRDVPVNIMDFDAPALVQMTGSAGVSLCSQVPVTTNVGVSHAGT